MYVDDIPFENLQVVLTSSLQLDHENELRILRKRLEQVGFKFMHVFIIYLKDCIAQ
jgi:hypothetical protein